MRLVSSALHPISVKLLRQGHPWVTLDGFSRRFPVDASFIKGLDERKMDVAVLLHDPGHKNVRGRLWTHDRTWKTAQFWPDVTKRMQEARAKRSVLKSVAEREHCYWIFAEADGLPGLMLLQLGSQFVLQVYASVWLQWKDELFKKLTEVFPEITLDNLWLQIRSEDEAGQKIPTRWSGESDHQEWAIHEYGYRILVRMGQSYDYGLYTDMAAVRFALAPMLKDKKRVLNLYSYTGAFSLQALSLGAETVVSVDLSKKYLQWLEENLAQNDPAWKPKHRSLCLSVEDALALLLKEGAKFDAIICDPPSSSSDGAKKISALKAYERIWPDLTSLLAPGGWLLTFLNTHAVSSAKFESHLKTLTPVMKPHKRFTLQDDCPTIKYFHEGNYLKGIAWI